MKQTISPFNWSFGQQSELQKTFANNVRFLSPAESFAVAIQSMGSVDGGTLRLGSGVYFLYSDITVLGNRVAIIGNGPSTRIIRQGNARLRAAGEEFHLSNLRVEGGPDEASSDDHPLVLAGELAVVDNVTFDGCKGGLSITGDRFRVRQCNFVGQAGTSYDVSAGSDYGWFHECLLGSQRSAVGKAEFLGNECILTDNIIGSKLEHLTVGNHVTDDNIGTVLGV